MTTSPTAASVARKMAQLRERIQAYETEYNSCRETLYHLLKAEGRSREGEFIIKHKSSLYVTDKERATKWTQEHYPHLFVVDLTGIGKVLRREIGDLPPGFGKRETEYVSAISGNEAKDE